MTRGSTRWLERPARATARDAGLQRGLRPRAAVSGADRPGRQRLPRAAAPTRGSRPRPPRRPSTWGAGRRRLPARHRHATASTPSWRRRWPRSPATTRRAAVLHRLPREPRASSRRSATPTRWSSATRTSTRPSSTPAGWLGTADCVIVAHNDVDAVEAALRGRSATPRARARRVGLLGARRRCAARRRWPPSTAGYDAVLVVDEAHAHRRRGSGRPRARAMPPGSPSVPHVVITMTLSKALGSQGGAVLGHAGRDRPSGQHGAPVHLRHRAGPAAAAAALAALRRHRREPELPARALDIAATLAEALGRPAACRVASCRCRCRARSEARAAQAELAADGFAVGCFRPPSVPDGVSRLRLTARATLTRRRLDRVVRLASAGWPHPMRVVVVTGTNTGVGKTVVDGGAGSRPSGTGRASWW